MYLNTWLILIKVKQSIKYWHNIMWFLIYFSKENLKNFYAIFSCNYYLSVRNIASENHDIYKYFNLLYMINNISHVKK